MTKGYLLPFIVCIALSVNARHNQLEKKSACSSDSVPEKAKKKVVRNSDSQKKYNAFVTAIQNKKTILYPRLESRSSFSGAMGRPLISSIP